jgi:predicted RNA-binding Zn-ribbon protein involved in translation (DUF1610 family)
METKKHIPLPATTKAFICANCGAVSLSEKGICKVQGMGTKADWCGTKSFIPPSLCHNRVNNVRFTCAKCGKVAINPELLCDPERLPEP